MTRRDRVIEALRRSGGEMCALEAFYRGTLTNGRNEMKTLRESGWEIDSTWTRHGTAPAHAHYRVRLDPDAQPRQLAWVS